ncbi:hypothetical protein L1049_025701 [Liquidambar formosana]|uniref:glutaredoxin-dependent peroxiredoxin n=1 Tax=Liquidambar formosana TaxID=63359 RepID=A0AAP0NE50_LIQFO
MAASVNNIAATFATIQISSSSSSSSSASSNNQTNFALSISPKPISTSWNPHTTLPRSQKSSLLNLYGPPGPPPLQSISAVHRRPQISKPRRPISLIPIGEKLPNVTVSYLNRNDTVQTVAIPSLCKGKRFVLVGLSAAFSPSCTRFVKRVESAKSKWADSIACVAVNDVFVMRAWGEHLAVGEKVMMLSDGRGELSRALGVSLDANGGDCLGLGERSRRFCLSAFNGVITSVDFDEEEDDFISRKKSTVI